MTPIAIFILLIFLFTLISRRIEKTLLTAPMIFTLVGMGVDFLMPRLAEWEIKQNIILLIAELRQMDGQALAQALQATFDTRKTHMLPLYLPDPPSAWTAPFRRLAEETRLDYQTLTDAGKAAQRFLDPVLRGEVVRTWDPMTWSWQSP